MTVTTKQLNYAAVVTTLLVGATASIFVNSSLRLGSKNSMKRLALVGAIALAAGCTVDNSHLVQHSYTVEQHDEETGLTLEPSDNMWVSFEEMITVYKETEACMGMYAPGPNVKYQDFLDYYGNLGGFAFYTGGFGGHVFMNTYATDAPVGIARNNYTDTETLRHEYVHHILYANVPDWKHGDPMFALCGPGPDVNN